MRCTETFPVLEYPSRLTILYRCAPRVSPSGQKAQRVMCRCECGKEKELYLSHVLYGRSLSCGCMLKEFIRSTKTTHGGSGSLTYASWASMRQRCGGRGRSGRNQRDYKDRGITICPEWVNSYQQFLADMGERPSSKYSLDRIDNSKGYCPENCRWATAKEQMRNTRRLVLFEYSNLRKCLSEWCELSGVPRGTVAARYRRGWTAYQAVWTPVGCPKVSDDPLFQRVPTSTKEIL
jgi:hypothetical protein